MTTIPIVIAPPSEPPSESQSELVATAAEATVLAAETAVALAEGQAAIATQQAALVATEAAVDAAVAVEVARSVEEQMQWLTDQVAAQGAELSALRLTISESMTPPTSIEAERITETTVDPETGTVLTSEFISAETGSTETEATAESASPADGTAGAEPQQTLPAPERAVRRRIWI